MSCESAPLLLIRAADIMTDVLEIDKEVLPVTAQLMGYNCFSMGSGDFFLCESGVCNIDSMQEKTTGHHNSPLQWGLLKKKSMIRCQKCITFASKELTLKVQWGPGGE